MKFCIPMPRTVIKTEQVLNKFGPKETSSSQGRVKDVMRPCLAKHFAGKSRLDGVRAPLGHPRRLEVG